MDSSNKVKNGQLYDDRFYWPNPYLNTFVACCVAYTLLTAISPSSLPEILGPISELGRFAASHHSNVVNGLFYTVIISHIFEASYTWKVTQDRRYSVSTAIQWTLSTFIFGFPSLIRLLAIKPKPKHT